MSPNEALPDLSKECFFIAPIGEEGTDTRERSDGVLEYIVGPAAEDLDLVTIRADKIAKPGEITRQVIEHVVGAKAAVVDLTDSNPNVYYEMAVRHTARLPTVLIAEEGQELPFDIAQMRTIFFDHKSLKSAAECREQITQYLQEAIEGEVDSPISASVTVQRLEKGSPQDRVLAQLVASVDEIRGMLTRDGVERGVTRVSPAAIRDLAARFDDLVDWQEHRAAGDPDLEVIIRELQPPVRYMRRKIPERDWVAPSKLVDGAETDGDIEGSDATEE